MVLSQRSLCRGSTAANMLELESLLISLSNTKLAKYRYLASLGSIDVGAALETAHTVRHASWH